MIAEWERRPVTGPGGAAPPVSAEGESELSGRCISPPPACAAFGIASIRRAAEQDTCCWLAMEPGDLP